MNRSIEREVVPCCQAYGISVIPWGPLASGFLTGKYNRTQELPPRFAPSAFYNNVFTEANFDKLAKLEAFAKERGHKVGELAVSWLLSRPWLGSVITGATNPEQVSSNVAAGSWKLTAEEVKAIDKML